MSAFQLPRIVRKLEDAAANLKQVNKSNKKKKYQPEFDSSEESTSSESESPILPTALRHRLQQNLLHLELLRKQNTTENPKNLEPI